MSCQYGQHMVDRPKFEGSKPQKRGRRESQVIGKKSGVIRPDKRKKVKYL